LNTGVPEYFLLNHNSAKSRTLPDSAIISISEILNTAISLNKIFPNSELARKRKSKANQNNQKAKFPNREMIKIFLSRKNQKVRFAQLRNIRRLFTIPAYGLEKLRFSRKMDEFS
jgi:hypothetical protein